MIYYTAVKEARARVWFYVLCEGEVHTMYKCQSYWTGTGSRSLQHVSQRQRAQVMTRYRVAVVSQQSADLYWSAICVSFATLPPFWWDSKFGNVHAPKMSQFVHRFQNCFCFHSRTFPSMWCGYFFHFNRNFNGKIALKSLFEVRFSFLSCFFGGGLGTLKWS